MSERVVTPEMIAKLPVWAQKHISRLEGRAKVAERELREHLDTQTPSKVWYENYSLDENKRFYVQTDRVSFEHAGVHLSVNCYNGRAQDHGIALQWDSPKRLCSAVAFVPKSFQQAMLIAKENMT